MQSSSNRAWPFSRSEVIGIVERVLASRGIIRSVSAGWWSSFISRHPKVALRTPATLSLSPGQLQKNCL